MSVNIRDRMTADGKRFEKILKELAKLEVAVGYQDGTAYPDGTSVVDVALWNELGTVRSPSRPFLRKSVDGHKDEISRFMKRAVKEITEGKSVEEVLKKIGVFQQKIIRKEISSGNFEPNSPETVRRKGSDKPLIDTGLMRQFVNYVIREKGGSD